MQTAITNITELRDSLAENYQKMANRKMELKFGKELANTAGKMVSTLKVQMEYTKMRGENAAIEFLQKGH